MPALNLYEDIRTTLHFNKFVIGELLFAEYTCPIEDESVSIWTHTDYLVHVVSGKKTWRTLSGIWIAEAGQTLFFKKGAAIIRQFFDEDFCLLLFFIPDDFVKDIVRELGGDFKNISPNTTTIKSALRVNNDVALSAYFQSMLTYFSGLEKPSELLLRLKLKELIVSILQSQNNLDLSRYLLSLANGETASITDIMEANYCYNLSLQEFAELCHMSLSTFKRDFYKRYNESPGRWLLKKRLDYAAVLLRTSDMSISQILFECGFEDLSHFSKVFKDAFGTSPTVFRKHC
jgi:AraC-like DNA-binding protein